MTVIVGILSSFFIDFFSTRCFLCCENFRNTKGFSLLGYKSWSLSRLPATAWLVVYASGSKRQNTRNVPCRRYLNGAKFWRNRYVGKLNSHRGRSYRRSLGRVGDGPGLTFSLIEIEICRRRKRQNGYTRGWVEYISREEERKKSEMGWGIRSQILYRTTLSVRDSDMAA